MQQAAEFYAERNNELWIQTYKGNKFYLENPKFDIEEIAHSLSLQCRFTGHIKDFYSVAEHSILVAGLTKELEGPAFEGLMHDAHEAYFSDLASPWKQVVPDYKRVEHSLEVAMRSEFNLPPVITEIVKMSDWVALFIEARALLNGTLDDWRAPEGVRELADKKFEFFAPVCLVPREAERMFMEVYEYLRPEAQI